MNNGVDSKITGGKTRPIFVAKILGRYDVTYHQCVETGFIQTDDPAWLDEAYNDAITALDLGLVSRNIEKARLTAQLIERAFTNGTDFIDFGGGYGIFTRLMRDKGFNFVHYDTHCENLFAKGFEWPALKPVPDRKFCLLTAWEVLEHLANPRETIDEMLGVAEAVLFSTELVPALEMKSADDWWYFTPETGQHICFFTSESLAYLANERSLHFYSDGFSNHLFSVKPLKKNPFPKKEYYPLNGVACGGDLNQNKPQGKVCCKRIMNPHYNSFGKFGETKS